MLEFPATTTIHAKRAGRLLVLVAIAWLALPAPTASAHATLLATSPPAGYAVPTPPGELTLDFDEPVSIGAAALALTTTGGASRPLSPATLSLGGRRLVARVPDRLALGGYQVHWQVTAEDGDPVSGIFTFAVGSGSATPTGMVTGAQVDPPEIIVLRWLLFTGFTLVVGGAVGAWLTRRLVREALGHGITLRPRPPLLCTGAAIGTLATLGLAVQAVGPDLLSLADTSSGRLIMVEAIAFLASLATAACLWLAHRATHWWLPALPLVAVTIAEGLRAHPHAINPALGFTVTVLHLLAVAAWLGTLIHVVRVAVHWRGERGWARLLGHDYARLAVILLLVVLASGTVEALVVLPAPVALVTTTYGIVLLVKLAVVTVSVVLAATARRRLRRSPATSSGPVFGRAARAEIGTLLGVLAVTAVLVSVSPPDPTTTQLAAPPPPTGLIVPAGTLAGEVTVLAQASADELVLHLTTPADDYTNTADDSAASSGFQVAGQLTLAGTAPHALALLGCGAGCFTAPVAWRPGMNQVALTIAAPPWPGGTALLDIPWAPTTDPSLLPSVLATMRAIPRLTAAQATTSDYAGYPGTEIPLNLPGTQFIDAEPYASGGGNPVVLRTLGEHGAETELGLAFPDGQVIRLYIDNADHRILREEHTTPNHLITTTFSYP